MHVLLQHMSPEQQHFNVLSRKMHIILFMFTYFFPLSLIIFINRRSYEVQVHFYTSQEYAFSDFHATFM